MSDPVSKTTKVMCDCELGHNGLGMAIRECDCDERKAAMVISQTTKDQRIDNAIYHTLQSFGMRLPTQHEMANIDERIELMQIMAARIAKAVKDVQDAN